MKTKEPRFSMRAVTKQTVIFAIENEELIKRRIGSFCYQNNIPSETNSRYNNFIDNLTTKEDFDIYYSDDPDYTIKPYVLSRLKAFLQAERNKYYAESSRQYAIVDDSREERYDKLPPFSVSSNNLELSEYEEGFTEIEARQQLNDCLERIQYYDNALGISTVNFLVLMQQAEVEGSISRTDMAMELLISTKQLNKIKSYLKAVKSTNPWDRFCRGIDETMSREELMSKLDESKEYRFYRGFAKLIEELVTSAAELGLTLEDLALSIK